MAKKTIKDPVDRKHEAMVERGRKKFQAEFGDQIHYTLDSEKNPRVKAFSKVMRKQALRKVN